MTPEQLLQHSSFLHGIARGLVRDDQAAEDLVQDTMLKAMQSPRKPGSVRGWLATIIRNTWRSQYASAEARDRPEKATARDDHVPAADEVATRRQVLKDLVDAVFDLDEPYRTAVMLRYYDELAPGDIARRLGVPSETVRTRVKRGLSRLRARLDGRHAHGIWVAAITPLGMPSPPPVEASSSSGAAGKAASTPVFTSVGAKVAAVFVGAVALGWAILAWTGEDESGTLDRVEVPFALEGEPGDADVRRRASVPGGGDRLDEEEDEIEVAEVPTRRASDVIGDEPVGAGTARPLTGTTVVRGRCVAAESGVPLRGCRAVFDGWSSGADQLAVWGGAKWKDPTPQTTGADGTFEFRFDPPPPYQFHLDIAVEGRVPRTERWTENIAGHVIDLGDIPFSRGAIVTGEVVTRSGRIVERVGVDLNDLPLPLTEGSAANDNRGGVSGSDGRFEVDVPIPAGTYPLDLFGGDRWVLVSPEKVTIPDASEHHFRVVVEEMPYIAGRVVDEQGRPAPGGLYLCARPSNSNHLLSDYTDKRGEFRIYGRPEAPDRVRIEISDPGPFERRVLDETYAWGTHDIEIVLKRAQTIPVVVTESGTGRPVTSFSVRCFDEARRGTIEIRQGGEHAEGKLDVTGVVRGKNRLEIIPRDRSLRPSDPVYVDVTDAPVATVHIEVKRLSPVRVRVLDAEGAPAPNMQVAVVDLRGNTTDPEDISRAWEPFAEWQMGVYFDAMRPLALATGVTDEDGWVSLHTDADVPVRVRVTRSDEYEDRWKPQVFTGVDFDDAALRLR